MSKRLTAVALLVVAAVVAWFVLPGWLERRPPLRLGVLLSLTGPFAAREALLLDAYRLAADEVNAGGGVLGRPIELLVRDGASDPGEFQKQAANLFHGDRAEALFGCWDGACRRAVEDVAHNRRGVLFCPGPCEGLAESEATVFTGLLPGQTVVPAVTWLFQEHGRRRFFLVGTDGACCRIFHAVAREQVRALGGEVAGEKLLPSHHAEPERLAEAAFELRQARPDVVVCSCDGHQALALVRLMRDRPPVVFVRFESHEVPAESAGELAGDYLATGYAGGDDFARRLRSVSGTAGPVGAGCEAAYVSVLLWKQAVAEGGSARGADVLKAVRRQSLHAPGGPVSVDPGSLHVWHVARVLRMEEAGDWREAWTSGVPVRPLPFPAHRTREEWATLRERLLRRSQPGN